MYESMRGIGKERQKGEGGGGAYIRRDWNYIWITDFVLLQADMLCGLQNQHEAEIAALAKCRQLVGRASYALEKKRRVSHISSAFLLKTFCLSVLAAQPCPALASLVRLRSSGTSLNFRPQSPPAGQGTHTCGCLCNCRRISGRRAWQW